MEDAVNASAARGGSQVVLAGAGYAGSTFALLLMAKLRNRPEMELTILLPAWASLSGPVPPSDVQADGQITVN